MRRGRFTDFDDHTLTSCSRLRQPPRRRARNAPAGDDSRTSPLTRRSGRGVHPHEPTDPAIGARDHTSACSRQRGRQGAWGTGLDGRMPPPQRLRPSRLGHVPAPGRDPSGTESPQRSSCPCRPGRSVRHFDTQKLRVPDGSPEVGFPGRRRSCKSSTSGTDSGRFVGTLHRPIAKCHGPRALSTMRVPSIHCAESAPPVAVAAVPSRHGTPDQVSRRCSTPRLPTTSLCTASPGRRVHRRVGRTRSRRTRSRPVPPDFRPVIGSADARDVTGPRSRAVSRRCLGRQGDDVITAPGFPCTRRHLSRGDSPEGLRGLGHRTEWQAPVTRWCFARDSCGTGGGATRRRRQRKCNTRPCIWRLSN